MDALTTEEKKAIKALKKVAKIWPDTLWLVSISETLYVMKCGEDGEHVIIEDYFKGGIDQNYIVDTIEGISNDGGDF